MTESEIKIYQTDDGQTTIDVKFENETVWLNQKQMAQLFDKDSDTIGLHLKNIYQSGELEEFTTTEESSVIQKEGNRQVQRKIKIYNLDAIISVGYRVNSKRGIQFRIWASRIIKEYLLTGFVIDNKRLIQQNNQLKELQPPPRPRLQRGYIYYQAFVKPFPIRFKTSALPAPRYQTNGDQLRSRKTPYLHKRTDSGNKAKSTTKLCPEFHIAT